MADQASVNRSASLANGAAPEGVVESIAEFVNDVTTLADLQTQLAIHDTKDVLGRATWPAITVAAGLAIALASLVLTLFGLANTVAKLTQIDPAYVQLALGVGILVVAGVVAFVSYKAVVGSLDSYRRSREELSRNLAWLRTVIVHSGRPGSRRQV